MFVRLYINKAIKFLNKQILHHIEYLFLPRFRKPVLPYCPVFIIGAPRSGSTLITQVITDAFNVSYLSNGHCRFFGAPVLADRMLYSLGRKRPSDFTSDYGNTRQLYAPAECGEFWYRFFRREPAYVTVNDVDEHKMAYFRSTVSAFMEIHRKPIIFKNLYTTLRLRPICKFLPQALFIIIKRNEAENADSILRARLKLHGDYRTWWSVPPPNIQALKKMPPEQQAIEQIRQLHALIERDINEGRLDRDRFLTIDFDAFCGNVHSELKRIDHFFQRHGMNVQRLYPVPETFPRTPKVAIDSELSLKLKAYSEGECWNDQLHTCDRD